MMQNSSNKTTWLVTADMGYGHQRAIYPLRNIGQGNIVSVGNNKNTPASERKLWKRTLKIYELLSRAREIPLVGNQIFKILDYSLMIPSYYPYRNLSKSSFQVRILESSIKNGLCRSIIEKVTLSGLPLTTSFYAPAIAADLAGYSRTYCIICDTDLNRVWVRKDPWESNINYFAPCGRAAGRLKAYGVPENHIHITGFPLPKELMGDENLSVLKKNLGQRLHYLDPNKRFWSLYKKSVKHFLGKENCEFENSRVLTITYAVGGAGAQAKIGKQIAFSLKEKLIKGEIKLNLVAGTRPEVANYFNKVKESIQSENIEVICSKNIYEYFDKMNEALQTTDVLWSKPSELSFYCALGIPIIMTPTIGSQERFNKKWLQEIQAGFKQENPAYTDQWLTDLLHKGRLAEAAWAGFLKARKKGTFNIEYYIQNGHMPESDDTLR
ncbi:hypothetical protein CDL62_04680 [Alkalitalea saponilacus]|uniref:DUF6938 domain-containing protein n=2 Tax=Alkalitalea saponilacus TaxID=889453 RepID=A0A1T5HQ85_9BACT|nr:hypothetical protein CDL62_04680 [Alkalitalea saponilacus]SKC22691.1 hypothetical protein SAMN03080601_02565 [Alkalitalea saponilacus]